MKTQIAIILVFLVLLGGMAMAQPPDTLWTKTYGGSSQDKAYCVQQTTDGGYILAGATQSFGAGNWDFYLVKTDANGNALWTRTYGGPALDFAYYVQQTTDGGYMVAGYTTSYGAGSSDFYLVKTDAGGNPLWTQTYGGSAQEYCYSAQQTAEGGYILAGCTFSSGAGYNDYYLVKTDASGNAVWARTYGSIGTEECYDIQQTTDGGFIAAGVSAPFGNNSQRAWLVKTNSAGDTLWTSSYDGNGYDYAQSVRQTTDGGYIAAGRTDSYGAGGYDFYLIKTDFEGDTLWTRTYGGSGPDMGFAVQQTTDGGYIISGYTTSYGAGDWDFYLVRTDATGDPLWSTTYGGSSTDECRSIQQTSDGGFVAAGNTGSFGAGSRDFFMVRLEAEAPVLTITITLTPINPPIQVPPGGGSFNFNASVMNNGSSPVNFDAWIMVQLPSSSWYGPVLGPLDLTLPGGATVSRLRTQNVPASAPVGVYCYEGRVGDYPATITDTSKFGFTKLGAEDEGLEAGEWTNTGEEFNDDPLVGFAEFDLPQDFIVSISPNPFNSTTDLRYQILDARNVSLRVYDTAGRLVTELVNGWRKAGEHEATFDGADLPSGVYFCHMQTGNFNAMKKMVLVK